MKFTKFLVFFSCLFLFSSVVSAQNYASGGSSAGSLSISSLPADIRGAVSEEDWAELYSLEAKVRGGEAVAKVKILAELLPPLLAKCEELGVEVPELSLEHRAEELESKLEAISQEKTIGGAEQKLEEFISYAQLAQEELNGEVIQSRLEPVLKAKGEEIKKELEENLNTEAEELGNKAEEKLREQAELEAEQMERDLRNKITAQIEAELTSRYGGQTNPDMSLLRSKAEELKREKEPTLIQEAKAELNAKYEKLATEERARIGKIMEEKADELGGETKKKLEEIKIGFEDLNTQLEEGFTEEMSRWEEFSSQALEKKKEILLAVVEVKIEKGKELIREQSENLEKARDSGKDISSAEELIAKLEIEKREIIDALSSGELNQEVIREATGELEKEWEEIRLEMEKMKAQSGQEVYQTLKTRLIEQGFNPDNFSSQTFTQKRFEGYLAIYDNWVSWCNSALADKQGDGSKVLAYCSGGSYKEISLVNKASQLGADLSRGAEIEAQALNKLEDFSSYNKNSDYDDLMAYKEELVKSLNNYKEVANNFKSKYPSALELLEQMDKEVSMSN